MLHNTSRVVLNISSGVVSLPCAPHCDSLVTAAKRGLPLVPISVESLGHPCATRPRAFLRMDPPMDQRTARPIGVPMLYALDSLEGKVLASCLLPQNMSYGLALSALHP